MILDLGVLARALIARVMQLETENYHLRMELAAKTGEQEQVDQPDHNGTVPTALNQT